MAWVYLLIAGLLEIAWAVGIRVAVHHPRYWPTILAFVLSIGSFAFLMLAIKHQLPLGTSYAVWTGIGAVGVALCGMLFFSESTDPRRLFFMALVVVGILGLKFFETAK